MRVDGDQRLLGQPVENIDDIEGIDWAILYDRIGGLDRKGVAEHGKPLPDRLLVVAQRFKAPIDHRSQGLVPRQRGAPTLGQDEEPIAKPSGKTIEAKEGNTSGRQFDGEG